MKFVKMKIYRSHALINKMKNLEIIVQISGFFKFFHDKVYLFRSNNVIILQLIYVIVVYFMLAHNLQYRKHLCSFRLKKCGVYYNMINRK